MLFRSHWEARGQVVTFPGYTKYWNNLSADNQLPLLQRGLALTLKIAQADAKQTQHPPRYSEPKLVQLMERKGIGRPSTYAPTVKTLREREYVMSLKDKLQPTALGLDLDSALEKLLPDLIQPEFTAKMEADLDRIADGNQNWEQYLTHWHRDYFEPAIASAIKQIGTTVVATTKRNFTSNPASGQTHELSRFNCPKCQKKMSKIPSKSTKIKANHFLKCMETDCDSVMFWNPTAKKYELPYTSRPIDPQNFTDHPCPVCGALLERYGYVKEGKEKVMLRCSILDHRREKCKEVAFFETQDGFWSPKFGTIGVPSNQTKSKQGAEKKKRKKS